MAREVGKLHFTLVPGIGRCDFLLVGDQDAAVEALVGRAVIGILIPFPHEKRVHRGVAVAAGGVRIAVLVRRLGGIAEAEPFREAVVAGSGVREMDAPDGLLAVVAHPVEILLVGIGAEIDAVGKTAGPLVGVHPEFALVLLQVEFGDVRVGAFLEPGDHLGFGDAGHVALLIEARVEEPYAAHEGLGGVLRGAARQVVVLGVTIFGRDHGDGILEVRGDGCINLVNGSLGHVLHLGGKRQREGLPALGHLPKVESTHEVHLTQVPGLVVAREEVVVHLGDGLQGEVATEQTVVEALPDAVVLVAGRGEQTIVGRGLLGALGAGAVDVVAGDHAPEQVDLEDGACVQRMRRRVGRVDQLLCVLLGLGEGGGIRLRVVLRIEQAVKFLATDEGQETYCDSI